jgi:hypothetical protein
MNPEAANREANIMYALGVLAKTYGAKPKFSMNSRNGMAVDFVWPEATPLETQAACAEKAEKIIESFGGECC